MADTPPGSAYLPGDWVIRRSDRLRPVRVVAIHAYLGAPCGYLVEHDGAGIEALSGDDIRPCPPERIPRNPPRPQVPA